MQIVIVRYRNSTLVLEKVSPEGQPLAVEKVSVCDV